MLFTCLFSLFAFRPGPWAPTAVLNLRFPGLASKATLWRGPWDSLVRDGSASLWETGGEGFGKG